MNWQERGGCVVNEERDNPTVNSVFLDDVSAMRTFISSHPEVLDQPVEDSGTTIPLREYSEKHGRKVMVEGIKDAAENQSRPAGIQAALDSKTQKSGEQSLG
ncbi:MAG: hypothetical protein MK052_01305 [Alphaproteobacteria bacterium]|nr:hypothetical protein [Alphaproteobacteria bacterium]